MITTRKISDGQYIVYESNKQIGTVQFKCDRLAKKIYQMLIPKYNIDHGVAMIVENFKNPEKAAVNILIKWLKEVAKKHVRRSI